MNHFHGLGSRIPGLTKHMNPIRAEITIGINTFKIYLMMKPQGMNENFKKSPIPTICIIDFTSTRFWSR